MTTPYELYKCPSCGEEDGFIRTAPAIVTVNTMIFVDGQIRDDEYSAELTDWSAAETISFHCSCGATIDRNDFDPAVRTAKMLEDLKSVLADLDELSLE